MLLILSKTTPSLNTHQKRNKKKWQKKKQSLWNTIRVVKCPRLEGVVLMQRIKKRKKNKTKQHLQVIKPHLPCVTLFNHSTWVEGFFTTPWRHGEINSCPTWSWLRYHVCGVLQNKILGFYMIETFHDMLKSMRWAKNHSLPSFRQSPKSPCLWATWAQKWRHILPLSQCVMMKIAALFKRKILREGITPWEECTGSNSTRI